MGRKKKKQSKRRDKSKSRRTRISTSSHARLLEQPSPDHTREAFPAEELQVQWAPDQVQVLSSVDQTQATSSPDNEKTTTAVRGAEGSRSMADATASTSPFSAIRHPPRRGSSSSKISKASKSSRASHGVSWGNVQTESADAVPDRATSSSHPLEGSAPSEEDKVVERRLVAMFKRQLKTFLFPPKMRQNFWFPLDSEDKSILSGLPIREERRFPWMIHPKTTFRNAWDMCMVVMSFASVFLVPLNIAYFEGVQEERLEWHLFNIASDVLFFADVIFNFRTGVAMKEDHGRINMDPEYVAVQYRRGWFYVDSFCCIPLDYTAMVMLHTGDAADEPSITSAYPSVLRINKLLSLPKIGRLTTIIRNIADVEENFFVYSKGVYVRLLFHLGLLFLLIHWHGCLQYYVDRLEEFPTNSWVARLSLVVSAKTERDPAVAFVLE
ncbi:hypothetical protein HPB50_026919 [Hyalomma asiaticum]|uniref:Uncharacterized protein n=1 Tax=Hyalomma asiaticum TaxID=266040 RepID=A0ACB7T2G4_HYAAI|nr:hypothetical protein HPB50_026919 [Hyalomma asiaticum]